MSSQFAWRAFACGALCILLSSHAHAVSKTWVPGSGSFSTASKWSPSGVPTKADTLNFRDAFSGTVSLTGNVSTGSIHIWPEFPSDPRAVVTFDMNGHTWNVINNHLSWIGDYN